MSLPPILIIHNRPHLDKCIGGSLLRPRRLQPPQSPQHEHPTASFINRRLLPIGWLLTEGQETPYSMEGPGLGCRKAGCPILDPSRWASCDIRSASC